jgi:hypothetical protein
MRVLFVGLFVLAGFGCEQQNTAYVKPFLDVDSLVTNQVRLLTARKAILHKTATVGNRHDDQLWQPDSAQWANEFDIFRQFDAINRPGFRGVYEATTAPDTQSNLLVERFAASQPAPVSWLKVYYLQSPGNIRKMEGYYQEHNALFTSARHVTWELEPVDQRLQVTHFTVRGFQKMVASDSVQYRIEGIINE